MQKYRLSVMLYLCAAIASGVLISGCGGGKDDDDEQRPVTVLVVPAGTTGGALGKLAYNNYCVQCHAVGSVSATNTFAAIASVGAMANLSGHVTQADVDAMVIYLANPAGF